MYIYIYIHIYMYVCIYIYTYIFVYTDLSHGGLGHVAVEMSGDVPAADEVQLISL